MKGRGMSTVYLAGPITGLSYGECTDWREYAIKELDAAGIRGVSPLRAKSYLSNEGKIADSYEQIVLSSSRGITTRDRWDATRCDVLLASLLGADRVSIGTVMEVAWADLSRIPIVLVMEKEKNLHDHAMLREVAGFRVETLEEGLNVVKAILSVYS